MHERSPWRVYQWIVLGAIPVISDVLSQWMMFKRLNQLIRILCSAVALMLSCAGSGWIGSMSSGIERVYVGTGTWNRSTSFSIAYDHRFSRNARLNLHFRPTDDYVSSVFAHEIFGGVPNALGFGAYVKHEPWKWTNIWISFPYLAFAAYWLFQLFVIGMQDRPQFGVRALLTVTIMIAVTLALVRFVPPMAFVTALWAATFLSLLAMTVRCCNNLRQNHGMHTENASEVDLANTTTNARSRLRPPFPD